jgi:hypothetical protein
LFVSAIGDEFKASRDDFFVLGEPDTLSLGVYLMGLPESAFRGDGELGLPQRRV